MGTKQKDCGCLEKSEAKTVKHIQESLKKKHEITRFDDSTENGIQQKALMFSGPMSIRLFFEVHVRYWFRKVSGAESAMKTYKTNLMFSYCPFCGTKYPEDKDDMKPIEQEDEGSVATEDASSNGDDRIKNKTNG